MAHINTTPGGHDHTVSFFIIRLDTDEPRLILHVHKRIKKLMMFGGHIEATENPWTAAVREIVEETGYRIDQLGILQPDVPQLTMPGAIVHPAAVAQSTARYPGEVIHFHSDTAYALVTDQPAAGVPGAGESTEFRFVTATELETLTDEEIVPMWRELGLAILRWHLSFWHPVPVDQFTSDSDPVTPPRT